MLISLKRIVRSGFEKFFRDRSSTGAALVVMTIVLLVVSALFILQGMTAFLIQKLQESVDVSAYFQDTVGEEEIFQVRQELSAQEEVLQVEYVSKEEALKRFIEANEGQQAILAPLDALGRNPLRAHLNVRARDPSQYAAIAEFLSREEFAPLVASIDFRDRAPIIERLSHITAGIRFGVLVVIIALSAIAVLVAFNTIRLTIYNSKEEVEIMRLVGASNWFIQGPYFVQGVLVGVAATVATFVLVFALTLFAGDQLQSFTGFDVASFVFAQIFWLLLLELAVGIGLGVVSAAIAIHRYLKV